MVNLVLILLCIGSGIIISRLRLVPRQAYKSINAWVLYIAVPALSLRYIPEITWSMKMVLPALSPIIVCGGAWIFASFYAKLKSLTPETRTALIVTCGLGNTTFLGFPMIGAYYGEEKITNALLFDQMTFLLFSTFAVILVMKAAAGKEQKVSIKAIGKKVFTFPPFIACMLALILPRFVDISVVNPLLDKLVATVSPMALFSIGLQLRLGELRNMAGLITAGIGYKLIIAPFLVLVFAIILGGSGDLAKISVFEASMPSHITASLLLSQHNLNRKFCTMVVGAGIIASLATTGLWWFVLERVF